MPPPASAELALQLAFDGPRAYAPGASYAGERSPAGWLISRGMAITSSWDSVVLVREVGLALRGGTPFPEQSLVPPKLPVDTVDPIAVDRAAAERVMGLVADITATLDAWSSDPPSPLKAGGLGVQAVRRVAKAIDRPERETARVIELAAAAGLVSLDGPTGSVLPLATYDHWCQLEMADRWSHLVRSWLSWDLHPSLAGALDEKRKAIPALLVRAPEPHAAARRRAVLSALAAAEPGTAVPPDALVPRAAWDAPQIWTGGPASPPTLMSWVLAESEMLGLGGSGALSTWGRLVATGDMAGARGALAELTPPATTSFVVQADLTALAPGELARSVRIELESMADIESRGAAVVFRFTESSLNRSFELGHSADDIVGFLRAHAEKGVPQALEYMVNDVGRRFGTLRVAPVACCVHTADLALLAEVVASRAGRRLGLRILAPTVAGSPADPAATVRALSDSGYLPAPEAADGSLELRQAAPRRAAPDPWLTALNHRVPGSSAAFGPSHRNFVAPGEPDPGGQHDTASASIDEASSPAAVAARLLQSGEIRPEAKPPAPPALRPDEPSKKGVSSAPVSLFDLASDGRRPDHIGRDLAAVRDLLEQAWIEDWPVRIAYTSKKGRSAQVAAVVLDVDDRSVLVQTLPGWGERTLALRRLAWVRVLTEAEEDAL